MQTIVGHMAGSQNAFSWAPLVPVAYKPLGCTPQTKRESQLLSCGWPPSPAAGALGQPGPTAWIHPSPAPSISWAAVAIVILFTSSASRSFRDQPITPSHYRIHKHTHTCTHVHKLSHNVKTSLSCTRWVSRCRHLRSPPPPSYLSAPLSGLLSTPSLR